MQAGRTPSPHRSVTSPAAMALGEKGVLQELQRRQSRSQPQSQSQAALYNSQSHAQFSQQPPSADGLPTQEGYDIGHRPPYRGGGRGGGGADVRGDEVFGSNLHGIQEDSFTSGVGGVGGMQAYDGRGRHIDHVTAQVGRQDVAQHGNHSFGGEEDTVDHFDESSQEYGSGEYGDFEYDEHELTQLTAQVHKLELGRRAVHDLPLPSDYYGAIQRLQHAKKMREEKLEEKNSLSMRNYSEKQTEKFKITQKTGPTVPRPFRSAVEDRKDSKSYSFRKPKEMSQPEKLSMAESNPSLRLSSTAQMIGIGDVSNSYLLSTLRQRDAPTSKSSHANTSNKRIQAHQHMHSSHASLRGYSHDTLDRPTGVSKYGREPGGQYYDGDGSQGGGGAGGGVEGGFSGSTGMGMGMGMGGAIADTVISRGGVPRDSNRVEPRAPSFASDDGISRRQMMRAERKHQQLEEEQRKLAQEKYRKELLRQKALQTAIHSGAYRPEERQHPHEKIVSKYTNRPDIGLDLVAITASAHSDYAARHSVLGVSQGGGVKGYASSDFGGSSVGFGSSANYYDDGGGSYAPSPYMAVDPLYLEQLSVGEYEDPHHVFGRSSAASSGVGRS